MTDSMLIADSGSTKTKWMMVKTGNMTVTEGLNPHFTTDEQFLTAIDTVRQRLGEVSAIIFYGAGCGNAAQCARTQGLLCQGFKSENIKVYTDMLGACRAVAGNEAALVGILGTGSNACYYDGVSITHQTVSTGFILGDEGSANHVGRVLLNGYLAHHMPERLRIMFHDTYRLSDNELMEAIYHQPHPNRFLASLAPFAVQHLDDDYCRRVVTITIEDWINEMVMPLWREVASDNTIHVVGGYAKVIESTLSNCLENNGLVVGSVIADPIEGLRQYHLDNP